MERVSPRTFDVDVVVNVVAVVVGLLLMFAASLVQDNESLVFVCHVFPRGKGESRLFDVDVVESSRITPPSVNLHVWVCDTAWSSRSRNPVQTCFSTTTRALDHCIRLALSFDARGPLLIPWLGSLAAISFLY